MAKTKTKKQSNRKKHLLTKKQKTQLYILIPMAAVAVTVWAIAWSMYGYNPYPDVPTEFGVTFSTKYSEELGLDWKEAYIATLDDLQIKHYRIPVYWDEIEPVQGELQLDDVRFILDEAEKHDAKIFLAIGERVPRWPECHPPEWALNLWRTEREEAEMRMVEQLVIEFKDHPALEFWQVTNEPLFAVFGECPTPNEDHVKALVSRVKELDPEKQILITDSGELSTWVPVASIADVLGISMYRTTWNSILGYFYYPIPPKLYSKKAELIAPLVDDVVVTELQVEPWPPGSDIVDTPLDVQFHSMDVEQFESNVDYARRTGFSEVYLWGVEWWYWLKTVHNDDSMWEAGKNLFTQEINSQE